VGVTEQIDDGELLDRLDDARAALLNWLGARLSRPKRIYCLAWEGGHPDHDAAHLVALALARALDLLANTWQFSLYNGRGAPGKLFRVMHLADNGTRIERRLSLREGLSFAFLAWRYPSQVRTWIGLFPETFLKYAIMRREQLSKANIQLVRSAPDGGRLFYERRFNVTYASFAERAAGFIAEYLAAENDVRDVEGS
jgi:hypothetical protein